MDYPIISDWSDKSFFVYLAPFLIERNIPVKGILHVGAHTCEERSEYNACGIPDERIVWIEGNKDLCEQNKQKGIPNVYNTLISDTEKEVVFHITNNMASSSIFPLSIHKYYYPHIQEIQQVKQEAISLKTFFERNQLNPTHYNMWNLDIQGGEYDALKGAGDLLDTVDIIFAEINFESLYENIPLFDAVETFLKAKGFCVTHMKIWQKSWGDALFVRETYL